MDVNETEQQTEQLRDEFGRFTKAEPEAVEVETQETEAEPSLEDTLSRLLDEKLKGYFQQPQAQTQQSSRSVVRREIKQPTKDELFEIQQLQLSDPVAAARKIHEFVHGETVEQTQKRLELAEAIAHREAVLDAGNRFMQSHPEFHDSNANGKLMFDYMNTRGWDTTQDSSYEQAYKDLAARNLIEGKPQPVTPAPKKAMSGIKRGSTGSQPVQSSQSGQLSPEDRQKLSQMKDDEIIAMLKAQQRSQTR
jgi:hypothetical protein